MSDRGAGERPDGGEGPADPGRRPDYKVYRSRRGLRDRLRPRDELSLPDEIERRRARANRGLLRGRGPREGGPERARRLSPGRVFRWLGLAVGTWLLLSLGLFMLSAEMNEGLPGTAEESLSSGGSFLTGSTVLVLGSDERPGGTRGSEAGPGRADSILLLRASFGSVRRLSILRDSFAEIPGHGAQKINAAYSLGGPGLMVETVESFLGNGLKVNHVIEVDFENFPELIDALGGVDITLRRCVKSGFEGRVFVLHRGERHLDGETALRFARIRKNDCAPNESDRQRARRQQQVLAAIRSKAVSPSTFFRLPWASWAAPRAVRTDMAGPNLLALFGDLVTGGAGATRVLQPSAPGPGGSLIVSESDRRRAVRRLVGD